MRRADRLFQIIQLLRRGSGPLTAADIAAELETSKRTIYCDVATLVSQRVPIRGEAGVGYMLEGGYDLPPLMLTPDEIEAAAVGARWVANHGDPTLARAALDLIAKVAAVAPAPLRNLALQPAVSTPPAWKTRSETVDVARLRAFCRSGHKLKIVYEDGAGCVTARTVWPFMIGYGDLGQMLFAWCEERRDYRMFRIERMRSIGFLEERYPERVGRLRSRWFARREKAHQRRVEA